MGPPTDSTIQVDKPNFNGPAIITKTWLFSEQWQRWLAVLYQALKVIDGGTP